MLATLLKLTECSAHDNIIAFKGTGKRQKATCTFCTFASFVCFVSNFCAVKAVSINNAMLRIDILWRRTIPMLLCVNVLLPTRQAELRILPSSVVKIESFLSM